MPTRDTGASHPDSGDSGTHVANATNRPTATTSEASHPQGEHVETTSLTDISLGDSLDDRLNRVGQILDEIIEDKDEGRLDREKMIAHARFARRSLDEVRADIRTEGVEE